MNESMQQLIKILPETVVYFPSHKYIIDDITQLH